MKAILLMCKIIPALMLFSVATLAAANEEDYVEEIYTEESYPEESYTEEVYTEETYPEESYSEDTYADESYQEESYPAEYNAEPSYDSGVEEPVMSREQTSQINQARTSCQQWASESGLEGEDLTDFVADCVFNQTGF